MRRSCSRAGIAALLLAFAPALAAQAPDTVRLRFGWEPGMRADVDFEKVRIRNTDGRRDSTRMAMEYRIEVKPHPEGLLIANSAFRWTELPQLEGAAGEFYRALAASEISGQPEYVVSPGAEFLRVHGMEEMAAELRAMMGNFTAELEGEGAEPFRQMMETMLSPEALATSAATEWNTMVGGWVDADLEVGGEYELEDVAVVPLFPGVELPVLITFEVAGRVPCHENDPRARCVELLTTSVPDRDVLRQALGEFMQRAGVPADQVEEVVSQMAGETYVTLITEPETLRPHAMEIEKVVYAGEEDEPIQVDTDRYRFRYPD